MRAKNRAYRLPSVPRRVVDHNHHPLTWVGPCDLAQEADEGLLEDAVLGPVLRAMSSCRPALQARGQSSGLGVDSGKGVGGVLAIEGAHVQTVTLEPQRAPQRGH